MAGHSITFGSARIGRRVHVCGNSCAGKTTLAKQLAETLGAPLVELDALNWQPNWHGLDKHDPKELERRIEAATAGESWVVAGSYMNFSQKLIWPKLETVIWLDLPMNVLVRRMFTRSWRRWRSKELLWGTNYEKFWPQLMIWRGNESLLWWIVSQHKRKRHHMLTCMQDDRWKHIRFVHLRSMAETRELSRTMVRS